jgi:CheY-like chemotaxis protein
MADGRMVGVAVRLATNASPRPRRVLVVERDWKTAKLLAQLLEDDGYEAEVSVDPVVAINRLGREPRPDVLVTEMRVAELDGRELARYARSVAPDIQVVVVTAYPELAQGLALKPPAKVFTKPIDYDALRETLEPRRGAA